MHMKLSGFDAFCVIYGFFFVITLIILNAQACEF